MNKDGGDETAHAQHHTLVLSAAANETGVAIEAGEDDTEVVLISGEPLDQPVVQYGPFGNLVLLALRKRTDRPVCSDDIPRGNSTDIAGL